MNHQSQARFDEFYSALLGYNALVNVYNQHKLPELLDTLKEYAQAVIDCKTALDDELDNCF